VNTTPPTVLVDDLTTLKGCHPGYVIVHKGGII